MITAELTRKINLLPGDSYRKVENFVEQFLSSEEKTRKANACRTFMKKMDAVENLFKSGAVIRKRKPKKNY